MLDIILVESAFTPTNLQLIYKKLTSEYSLPVKRIVSFQPRNESNFSDLRQYNLLFYSAVCGVTLYKKLVYEIKSKNYKILTVLLIDDPQSLSEFALPEICPNSVMLIPINPIVFLQIIQQSYDITQKMHSQSDIGGLIIKNYGDTMNIQYDDIYFFESLGKKVALKTRSQEIQFYSTFEELMHRLPSYFIRCHKGFVVNSRKIYSIQLSEMKLRLSDQSEIPLSRSYKDVVRKYMGGDFHD